MRILAVIIALLITAHRLPAPIQEVPENPTPSPAQLAKPKTKKTKTAAESSAEKRSSVSATPAAKQSKRFAGTWAGTMPEVPWGNVPTELIVDQSESTMEWREAGKPKTAMAAKTILNGDTLLARFSIGMTTAVWYISPFSDGVTANVRLTAFMNDQTAVFHRTTK